MLFTIHHHTTLREIKETFHAYFPGLKLEFFRKPHEDHGGSRIEHLIQDDSLAISAIQPKAEGKVFEVLGTDSVSRFETGFYESFGIPVQVFRRSRGSWLETTVTDGWSLTKQNEIGSRESNQISEMIFDPLSSDED